MQTVAVQCQAWPSSSVQLWGLGGHEGPVLTSCFLTSLVFLLSHVPFPPGREENILLPIRISGVRCPSNCKNSLVLKKESRVQSSTSWDSNIGLVGVVPLSVTIQINAPSFIRKLNCLSLLIHFLSSIHAYKQYSFAKYLANSF